MKKLLFLTCLLLSNSAFAQHAPSVAEGAIANSTLTPSAMQEDKDGVLEANEYRIISSNG